MSVTSNDYRSRDNVDAVVAPWVTLTVSVHPPGARSVFGGYGRAVMRGNVLEKNVSEDIGSSVYSGEDS